MRVGIISPVKYLNMFPSKLNLCYASLLSKKGYLDFCHNTDGMLILEDSPQLPRKPSMDRLEAAAKELKPAYVVLPSLDYSTPKTIELVKYFLSKTKIKKPVGVIQGYDIDSLQTCYNFLKDKCEMFALASPLETIAKRAEIARDLGLKSNVIWLEVYKNPYEEIPTKESVGICTSFPLRLAQVHKRLGEFSLKPSTPTLLDFEKTDLIEELASENVKLYIGAVQG
jgi:hypothetical protein